ncbi:PRA1 family protein [Melia azedarach]|uniref:PRA1 family protein n=1 Tax=Melia azedarach TaxID=155640 RepID=A0ACC1Y8R9_MELAZ|nr:PRA1 family protein [Melia azedarach]
MSLKPPTGYGTTAATSTTAKTTAPVAVSFFSRAESLTATRRPWGEFFNTSSLSLPLNYNDALSRIRRNANYFRVNYVMVTLFVLFVSLLWHPVSMIVFIIVFIAWLFFYFARDDPVVLFNQTLDDRLSFGLFDFGHHTRSGVDGCGVKCVGWFDSCGGFSRCACEF